MLHKDKQSLYIAQYDELIAEVRDENDEVGSWYVGEVEEVLEDHYEKEREWDDTLDFMDTIIELLEKETREDELIVVRAHMHLPDVIGIDRHLPSVSEAASKHLGTQLLALRLRYVSLSQHMEFYQCPIWHGDSRYHSDKLFTYYRCTRCAPDHEVVPEEPGRYWREIARIYSRKGISGNGPGFLHL